MDDDELTPVVELPIVEAAIDAEVDSRIAEEVSDALDDAHVDLEAQRIDAEVAKTAIVADAQVEIERLRAHNAEEDEERWSTLEAHCLWMMDMMEILEASNLILHNKIAALESAADRPALEKEVEPEEAEIEAEPPPPENQGNEEAPPAQQETRRRRRLIF